MLTSLLDSISKQFGSKSYWVSAMLPLILFLAANAVVAGSHFPWIAAALPKADSLDSKVLAYSVLAGVLLLLAYILSALSSFLLEVLEGKHMPAPLASALSVTHAKALRSLDERYIAAKENCGGIIARKPRWVSTLSRCRLAGQNAGPLDESTWDATPAAIALQQIRSLRDKRQPIPKEQIEAAVQSLAQALATNKAGKKGKLHNADTELRAAIQYAMDRYRFDQRSLLKQRLDNFPGTYPGATDQPESPVAAEILAPTAMGNIGRTMEFYTLVRYQLDLATFWTRIQNSLQKDGKEYYTVMQDTKVQVDCMVALFWLSLLFTAFWLPALGFFLPDATVPEFLTVSLAGSLAVVAFYRLACQSYRTFTDVVRSSVDLFRFQVLQALHIPLPLATNEERDLWFKLGRATAFFEPSTFEFKHPSP